MKRLGSRLVGSVLSRFRFSRFRTLVIGVTGLALVVAACVAQAPAYPQPGTPTQENTEAYQYPAVRDGTGDFVYNQLWYFSFMDDGGDSDPGNYLAGVAAYGLANPENLLGQAGVSTSFGMIMRDPAEGESFNVFSPQVDPAVPGNFSASTSFQPGPGPELQNPFGTIEVISPDEYQIAGSVTDGTRTITWDLNYSRGLGPGWMPWQKWPMPPTLGVVPAWITYHMQMPNAVVNGTFTVDDGTGPDVHTLSDAKGYHDDFSSEFVFSIIEWDWLDYKQSNLSVHMLHPHAPEYSCEIFDPVDPCLPGNLRVFYDGTEYNFYRGEVDITYNALAHDPTFGVDYPTEETITAEDSDGNVLTLDWTLLRQLPVAYDVPDPFDDTVTYEIIAEFSGSFHEARSNTTVPISGTGWADWSGVIQPTA